MRRAQLVAIDTTRCPLSMPVELHAGTTQNTVEPCCALHAGLQTTVPSCCAREGAGLLCGGYGGCPAAAPVLCLAHGRLQTIIAAFTSSIGSRACCRDLQPWTRTPTSPKQRVVLPASGPAELQYPRSTCEKEIPAKMPMQVFPTRSKRSRAAPAWPARPQARLLES